MKSEKKFFSARNITYLAILLALVIVLQVFGGFIKVGTTSFSLVLVPIVLGGMLLGIWAGAFLGFAFGLVVIFDALGGLDPFTLILLQQSPVFTVFLCIVKGVAAGVLSALLFKIINKKNKYAAVFVAAIAAPIINTGIFILGGLCMSGIITANFLADGQTVIYFLVIVCAGINFLVELAINLVCAPAIYTIDKVVEKQFMVKKRGKNDSVS